MTLSARNPTSCEVTNTGTAWKLENHYHSILMNEAMCESHWSPGSGANLSLECEVDGKHLQYNLEKPSLGPMRLHRSSHSHGRCKYVDSIDIERSPVVLCILDPSLGSGVEIEISWREHADETS